MPAHYLTHIPHGITPAEESDLQHLITHGRFLPHSDVTGKAEFLQIVPTIQMKGNNGDTFVRLLRNYHREFTSPVMMQKTHIFHGDRSVNPIEQSITRMLTEDFTMSQPYEIKFIGYVRDNLQRPDHLGLVYELTSKTKRGFRPSRIERTGQNWLWRNDEKLIEHYFSTPDPWDSMMIDKIFVEARKE